ncbi:cytochrome c biogenesis protein ResB [Streptomyces anulatus]|uniref:cytochrome c biogenesis protein ResB n=1 Tax=Streptomyces anulatus TaxID=1892 RepID=UPI000A850BE3|nr:cytochrome c biogenesis protein ResB [Streptomyces anulatus]
MATNNFRSLVDSPARGDASASDSEPKADEPKGLGPAGWLRWAWRSLTTMRTALVLLLLLALAAVPGSLVPQEGRQPAQAADFRERNPDLAPVLDRLGFFDVYASPWFAAVYLLLFVSLAGCIVPRTRQYVRTLRSRPPAAPSRLDRLPQHAVWTACCDRGEVLLTAADLLRRRRFRVDVDMEGDGSVSGEKGYLREAGNLVFHTALFGLLIALAVGSLFGTTGQKLVLEGDSFTNTVTQYDDFTPGTLASADSLKPFGFQLKGFSATYQRGGPQRGTASSFVARLNYTEREGGRARDARVEVNKPLEVDGSKVFLVGHGYAPVVTVRDGKGEVAWQGPAAFLPQDSNLTSVGVIKAPDALDRKGKRDGLGFSGLFLPTVQLTSNGWQSSFPATDDPVLVLTAHHGDLGMDSGQPQNVYQLDSTRMTQFREADGSPFAQALRPGDRMKLPGGAGSLTFDGIKQWASFQIARNPSNATALWSSVAMGLGLCASLFVRRRRVWVRVEPMQSGRVRIAVAGLDPGGTERTAEEVAELADELRERFPAPRTATPDVNAPAPLHQEQK